MDGDRALPGAGAALPSPPLFPANRWSLPLVPKTHRRGCRPPPPEGIRFETRCVLLSQTSPTARETSSSQDEVVVNSYSSVQIIPVISWYLQNSRCHYFNSSVQHTARDQAVRFGASSLVTTLICGVVIRETEESQVVSLFPSLPPLEIH